MKKTAFLTLMMLTMAAAAFCQSQGTPKELFPFATEFDSKRSLVVLCPTPQGFDRFPTSSMTPFQAWLTNLPLLPQGRSAVGWKGNKLTGNDWSKDGVIDIPVTSPDITDADILPLLALNFFVLDSTIYTFRIMLTEKDTLSYGRWLEGEYSGDIKSGFKYIRGERKTDTGEEFRRYLAFVTRHFDNKMLMKNAEPITHIRIRPGNMYIQFKPDDPDSVGHTTLILDVCRNVGSEIKVLAAMGGNPAQSLIVPRVWEAPEKKWFTIDELVAFLRPHGTGFFYRYTN